MGKILGSWSGMRKYLEQDMLAESLRGRVRYGCTAYPGMDGCHLFDVFIDGRPFKHFSLETAISWFKSRGMEPEREGEFSLGYVGLLDDCPVNKRTEYTDDEFCNALKIYRNQDISDSIKSEDPIVCMLALLDRRTGKRTLSALKEVMTSKPEWLQQLYSVRLSAEKMS